MKIAVLSGKGGTGKTTVSTNLAFISKLPLFDTDIEEPNSHIFLIYFLYNFLKFRYDEQEMPAAMKELLQEVISEAGKE